MTTAAESWLILLGTSLGIVTLLGLALLALSRTRRVRSAVVYCPENGLPVVVQDLSDMGGLITTMVTCRAFRNARPITYGCPAWRESCTPRPPSIRRPSSLMRDAPASGVRYPALAATADGLEAVVWVELPGLPAGSAPRRVIVNAVVVG